METIHRIPSYKSIPKHEYNQQWWEPQELDELIAKNIVEFDYEEWDWHNVVEEDEFAAVRDDLNANLNEHDSTTVLLVHPVHVLRYYQRQQQEHAVADAPSVRTTPTSLIQRQFCKIRKAQQQSYN